MRRVRLFLSLSLVAVSLMTVSFMIVLPASAADRSPLEKELPEWMSVGIESRWRAEGQHSIGFKDGNSDDFLLMRNRVSLGLKPTHYLQLHFMGQDARSAGQDRPNGSYKDTFDLREAYVTVGTEASWWHVKVGRQPLSYGSQRVIGAADWLNSARVFDAAKLTLGHAKDSVDVFTASVVENDMDRWDHHRQGNNLHGAYASLGSLLPGSKVEPYLLYRTNHLTLGNSWTTGLRSAGDLSDKWSYEAEGITQHGRTRPAQNLSAWAAMAQIQRHFHNVIWQPSLVGEANYASGDRKQGDGKTNTYDQLYPTNHSIYGIADQIGRSNTRQVRGGIWLHPRKWLTLKTEGHSFWLASRFDGLYGVTGAQAIAPVAGGAQSSHVGSEFDISAEAKPSRYYVLGAQYGHFFAGDFVQQNSPGAHPGFYAFYLDFRM